jgi:hypothetical protein
MPKIASNTPLSSVSVGSAEREKNCGFFKKLYIELYVELNNIRKTAHSFFSTATRGLISNPYPLAKKRGQQLSVYFLTHTPANTLWSNLFTLQRNLAIKEVRETILRNVAESQPPDLEITHLPTDDDAGAEETFTEVLTPEERKAVVEKQCKDTFKLYKAAFTPPCPSEKDYLASLFEAHYSSRLSYSTDDPHHVDGYREDMANAEATTSEVLLTKVACQLGRENLTWEDIYLRCIASFRHARTEVFSTLLQKRPAFLSQLGIGIPDAAAQYDTDFHTMLESEHRRLGFEPNLQNFLMKMHGMAKFRPTLNHADTKDDLEEFNDALAALTTPPLLLSKMAMHAVGMIGQRTPPQQPT